LSTETEGEKGERKEKRKEERRLGHVSHFG